MLTEEIDYLDGEFSIQESAPSTIAECVAIIGEEAVVSETTSNLRYRNKYPRVYRKVSEEVVKEHGFERAVKEVKKNKDGTDRKILVSEMDHLRAFLKADPETNRPILLDAFTRIAQSEPLYVKGERSGGGGKVSQAALDSANAIIAAGDDKIEAVISKIEEIVTGYKVGRDSDGNATPESIARGIMALNKKLTQDALKNASAVLAS